MNYKSRKYKKVKKNKRGKKNYRKQSSKNNISYYLSKGGKSRSVLRNKKIHKSHYSLKKSVSKNLSKNVYKKSMKGGK